MSITNSGAFASTVLKMDAQPCTPLPPIRDDTSAVYSFIVQLSNFRKMSPLSRLGVRLLAKASAARGLPLSSQSHSCLDGKLFEVGKPGEEESMRVGPLVQRTTNGNEIAT
jgi:hypothetical protein